MRPPSLVITISVKDQNPPTTHVSQTHQDTYDSHPAPPTANTQDTTPVIPTQSTVQYGAKVRQATPAPDPKHDDSPKTWQTAMRRRRRMRLSCGARRSLSRYPAVPPGWRRKRGFGCVVDKTLLQRLRLRMHRWWCLDTPLFREGGIARFGVRQG